MYWSNKITFLQIEYAYWSFYGKQESAKVLQMQTLSFAGPISLTKSQPKEDGCEVSQGDCLDAKSCCARQERRTLHSH